MVRAYRRKVRRMLKSEFRKGYVDADYPGLGGYAFDGEIISVGDGRGVMHDIMMDVEWIEDSPTELGPILHMKKGSRFGETLYALDSNDFPQPTEEEEEE